LTRLDVTSSVIGAVVVVTTVAVVVVVVVAATAAAVVVVATAPAVVDEEVNDGADSLLEHAAATTPKIATPRAPVPTVCRRRLRSASYLKSCASSARR